MSVEGTNLNLSVDSYAACREAVAGAAGNPAAVQELAPLIAESANVTVTRSGGTVTLTGKGDSVTLGVPELDEAEIDAAEVDLAALVAYLQMDCTERQLEVAQKRIEVTKERIEADHEATLAKGEELLEAASKAEKKAKRRKIISKILFYAMTLPMIFVITGAPVTPKNLLLAVVAVKVLEKVMEGLSKLNRKIIEGVGDLLEAIILKAFDILNKMFGVELSEKDKEVIDKVAHIYAGIKIIVGEILVSILIFHKLPTGAGKAAGKGAGAAAGEAAAGEAAGKTAGKAAGGAAAGAAAEKKAQKIVNGVMIGSALLSATSQVLTAAAQRDMALAQAEVEELQSYLRELQTRLQDEEDTSEELLQMIYQYSESVAEILASQAEVDVAITQQIA